MDSLDDLLNFSSDVDDLSGVSDPDDPSRPLPAPEEELEWLSNKDAFPPVETIADILSEQPGGIGIGLAKQQSPVSVLDSSTLKPPHKARSKRRRRRRACAGFPNIPAQPPIWNQAKNPTKNGSAKAEPMATTMGRKCQHCGAEKTPQWRAGPLGPKTLCNACGVRYKSGRLVPEYRPASSPSFSSELHSNSHRKVMEMRKQKYGMGPVVKPVDKG